MITEVAYLTIDPAGADAFEAAVAEAAPVIRAAEGNLGVALERVIEHPGQYRLMVNWTSVEDHMVTFRESEGFKRWRALAGPFFTVPPHVEHTETVAIVG